MTVKYTPEHEWIQLEDHEYAVVGITLHAQDALGDVVFVTLPDAGTAVSAGDTCGEVESTKSVSDVYAPVSGEVVRRNEALDSSPDLVNTDPYGEGWMFEVEPSEPAAADALLTAEQYRDQIG